ncbi:hypothetical protein JXM67_09770 [candidate division WOR-3 bacterium]|nr:hypothetical protein [candidate division WOR-3 bacterium]
MTLKVEDIRKEVSLLVSELHTTLQFSFGVKQKLNMPDGKGGYSVETKEYTPFVNLGIIKALKILGGEVDYRISGFRKGVSIAGSISGRETIRKTAIIRVFSQYDLENQDDLLALREGLFRRYMELALATIFIDVFADPYKMNGSSADYPYLFRQGVNTGMTQVVPEMFDWLKQPASDPIEREKERRLALVRKAEELWKIGEKVLFHVGNIPPRTRGVQLRNRSGARGRFIYRLNEAEQNEFKLLLDSLFKYQIQHPLHVSGKTKEVMLPYAAAITGEIAQLEGGTLTRKDATLAEILITAAALNPKGVLVVKHKHSDELKREEEAAARFENYTPAGAFFFGQTDWREFNYPLSLAPLNGYTMISISDHLWGAGGTTDISASKEEEVPAFLKRNVWWVFLHELMHAYPIYNWEYEENEEGEEGEYQIGPDEDTWKFLYEKTMGGNYVRKEWPLIWSDSLFNTLNAGLMIETSQVEWPVERVGQCSTSVIGDFTEPVLDAIIRGVETPPEHPVWVADASSQEVSITVEFWVNTSGVVEKADVKPGEHEKYPFWGKKALLCVIQYTFAMDLEHKPPYRRGGEITFTFSK